MLQFLICPALIVIGLSFNISLIRAQVGPAKPKLINYSIESGLPSSETYFVHQDRQGFIWICTDGGVVRYDGFNFKTFTIADGLVDDVVFEIHEDHDGRIWFISLKPDLCYYQNGRIYTYKYNKQIVKQLGNSTPINKDIYIDKSGNLHYSAIELGRFQVSPNGHIKKFNQIPNSIIIDTIDGQPFLSILNFYDSTHFSTNIIQKRLIASPTFPNLSRGSKNKYLLMNNTIYSLKDTFKLETNDITISVFSKDDKIFAGFLKNGVTVYLRNKNNEAHLQMSFLKDHSVTSVLKDFTGGYWFSTLENGVFYTPNLDVLQWDKSNGLIDNDVVYINREGHNIMAGYNKSSWQTLYNPGITELSNILLPFRGLSYSPEVSLHFNQLTPEIKKNKYSENNIVYDVLSMNCVYHNKKLNRIIGGARDIYEFTTDDFSFRGVKYTELNAFGGNNIIITTVLLNDNNEIYFGCSLGLYRVKEGNIVPMSGYDKKFKIRIEDLEYNKDWKNIAATKGKGVLFWEKNKIIDVIDKSDGLLSNNINEIFIDAKDRLWVCTNLGINLIEKIKGETIIKKITSEHGLISNEINTIYVEGDKVWVATKKGISHFDVNALFQNHSKPIIFISEFLINSKADAFKPKLPADLNSIQIILGSSNFQKSGKNTFRFRFSSNGQWQEINSNIISLSNPSSGIYNFEIQERLIDGEWSDSFYLYKFQIDNPVYLKWYAFLLYAFILGLILIMVYKVRIRQLTRKHQMKNQLINLERKALQAQMNPHFIFNSLNSIQSYLIYRENDKAEKYLLKFSQLVRRILNNSVAEEIKISEEIKTLEDYVELEKMRFKSRFNYEFDIRLSEDQQNLLIPGMLVQPFVENAIIHGFKELSYEGMLQITFEIPNKDTLRVSVSDNGKGYDPNSSENSKHISHGIRITRDRLKSYNSKNQDLFHIEIISGEDQQGTTVQMYIPIVSN